MPRSFAIFLSAAFSSSFSSDISCSLAFGELRDGRGRRRHTELLILLPLPIRSVISPFTPSRDSSVSGPRWRGRVEISVQLGYFTRYYHVAVFS